MAIKLDISILAYNKLEQGVTKLTIERLYYTSEILKKPIGDALAINPINKYKQELNDNAFLK